MVLRSAEHSSVLALAVIPKEDSENPENRLSPDADSKYWSDQIENRQPPSLHASKVNFPRLAPSPRGVRILVCCHSLKHYEVHLGGYGGTMSLCSSF